MRDGTEAQQRQQHGETEEDEENLQSGRQAEELLHSLMLSMLVRTACELGIPEILHEAAGPLSAQQIAQKLQTQPLQQLDDGDNKDEDEGCRRCPPGASRHMISAADLDRVLLCLATHGVFRASSSENAFVYHSTRLSSWLLPVPRFPQQPEIPAPRLDASSAASPDTHHRSFRGMLMFLTSPAILKSWLNLTPFLAHGPPDPFFRANSLDFWDFALHNPSFASFFDDAMASESVSLTALLCHYKGFADIRSLVDVGGGAGVAASHIAAAYPSLKLTCFDRPSVIARNTAQFSGVDYVGGDMFQSIPKADAVFIKRVLHDWSDDDCIKILKNCHKSLPIGGKLIIVDVILDINPNEMNRLSKFKTMTDVLMLAVTNGGQHRTKLQWEVLLANSNFLIQNVIELPSGALSIIEGAAMGNGTINTMGVSYSEEGSK